MSSTSKSLSSLIKSDNPETISHTDFQSHFSKFKENEFEGRIDPKTDAIKLNDAYWLEEEPLRKYSSKRQYQRRLRKEKEEGVTNALQDSGTNANVTNRKTVTRLNLQTHTLEVPAILRFGQGTIALSSEYVFLGPIIGRAYVIDSAPYTLISTGLIADKGLTVSMNRHYMTITDDMTGRLLYRKKRNKKTGLYELNLEDFLTIKSPKDLYLYKSASKIATNSYTEANSCLTEDSDSDGNEPDDDDNMQPPHPPTSSFCHTCMSDYDSNYDASEENTNVTTMSVDITPSISPSTSPLDQQQHPQPSVVADNDSIYVSARCPVKRTRGNATRVSPDLSRRIHLLHKRMLHPGREAMAQAIASKQWKLSDEDKDITPAVIRKLFDKYPCTACMLAKTNKLTQQHGSGLLPDHPGHTISFDYKGPINPTSTSGYTGVFVDVDIRTLYFRQTPTKSKSAEDIIAHLRETIAFYRSHGWIVKYIRCDPGSEFAIGRNE